MALRKIASVLTVSALTLAFTAGSFAADRNTERGDHILARADQPRAAGTRGVNLNDAFGSPAPATAADRRIELTPGSKWVNVTPGETVTFVQDGKAFTWRFDTGSYTPVFNLGQIAPGDFGAQNVRVYMGPDPHRL